MKTALWIVAAALVLGGLWLKTAREPNYLNLTEGEIRSRLWVGMSQEEVLANLGQPVWINSPEPGQKLSWTYFNARKSYAGPDRPLTIGVLFQDRSVSLILTEQKSGS